MQLYTGTDLARGAGIFDHMMGTQLESARLTRMRSRDAIGIIAAAFTSGLSSGQVENFIEGLHFNADDHETLKTILHMYAGDDERLHLWNFTGVGPDALYRSLRYDSRPEWRLTPATQGRIEL